MYHFTHKTEQQLNAALGEARENPSFVKAEMEIGRYVKNNYVHYGQMVKTEGPVTTAKAVMDDMRLDGYGALLDAVGDNLLALVPIVIIIALVPYISTQVLSSFNMSELSGGWAGGLKAEDVWVTASLLMGAVITISLVTLIIVQLKKFRRDTD